MRPLIAAAFFVMTFVTPTLAQTIEITPNGSLPSAVGKPDGSVAKIVKLEHAWRRLDGRNDDGFQVAPFPG
ncbi:hypothetical protein [Novosphingobium sp. CECT 9465]|uniref:hypothetical protein n=1 Tax=Novosphingobium sp. CECT 9465 TaxID=2829794 RepID=UPI001E2ED294|nr:hypothetical protein [Novosphingobium sp. CECT 9465]CAH0499070.1 hypothetical protein NVSP9465_04167 [Novosphingobium sp. CECT 9465]